MVKKLWKKIKGKFQKPWIRFYSMDAGVAEFYPLYPSQKLKRQWRINTLKEQHKNKSDCPERKHGDNKREWGYK